MDLKPTIEINMASVKVMRSHDYCHFEVVLTSNQSGLASSDVDALRKEAARLADKAVEQYKVAKTAYEIRAKMSDSYALKCAEETPESERSPGQKALIKFHADAAFKSRFDYDYQDDFDPREDYD